MPTIGQLDIQKVKSTVSSLENTERVIVAGSDEHLDAILEVRNNLIASTKSIRELVDAIEAHFNTCTRETADYLIVKVFPCFDLAKKITADLHSTGFAESLTTCLEEFNGEVGELYEIINDLSRHKSSSAESDENYF